MMHIGGHGNREIVERSTTEKRCRVLLAVLDSEESGNHAFCDRRYHQHLSLSHARYIWIHLASQKVGISMKYTSKENDERSLTELTAFSGNDAGGQNAHLKSVSLLRAGRLVAGERDFSISPQIWPPRLFWSGGSPH